MRRTGNRQRGEGQLGCIFGLLFLIAAAFIAYKMIPVKVKTVELGDEITDVARAAGMFKEPAIRKRIMSRADELDLPLDPDNLIVNRGGNRIYIKATYTVPVEFPGFTYEWEFEHEESNPLF
ncbi:MAG: hypothetical protein ACRD2J_15130 [Thermoanaerobaculia bacterium]